MAVQKSLMFLFFLSLPNRKSSLSCLDKVNQFFYIVEVIIIAINSFAVINNPCFFISRQAVQKLRFTAAFGKYSKSP